MFFNAMFMHSIGKNLYMIISSIFAFFGNIESIRSLFLFGWGDGRFRVSSLCKSPLWGFSCITGRLGYQKSSGANLIGGVHEH
jgi:hypothetical protein